MARLTLDEFTTQLRRSYLKDLVDPTKEKWEDEEIRDFVWWSMDTFVHHTAVPTSVVYPAATGVEFELPDNLYETVAETGIVYLKSGTSVAYLNPVSFIEAFGSTFSQGFYTMPDTVLHVTRELDGNYDLHVHYFAYYNHPYAPEDTIDVPQWAIPAISYLATAHALMKVITSTSNIRRFADKRDSGNPEHNPMLKQREHLLQAYEREILRYRQQNRTHFWRADRDGHEYY